MYQYIYQDMIIFHKCCFNIDELNKMFKTCTVVDPIVKQLFPEIDICTELYQDYKLTTIISGGCIDLYSLFNKKYHLILYILIQKYIIRNEFRKKYFVVF